MLSENATPASQFISEQCFQYSHLYGNNGFKDVFYEVNMRMRSHKTTLRNTKPMNSLISKHVTDPG